MPAMWYNRVIEDGDPKLFCAIKIHSLLLFLMQKKNNILFILFEHDSPLFPANIIQGRMKNLHFSINIQ